MDYYKISMIIKNIMLDSINEEDTTLVGFMDIIEKINNNKNNYAYCLVLFNKLTIELNYVLDLLNYNTSIEINEYFYNTDVSKKEIVDFIQINSICKQQELDHILHKCYVINMLLFGTFKNFKLIQLNKDDCIKTDNFDSANFVSMNLSQNIEYHYKMLQWIKEI